ncbi:hypothetical protein SISSUDRAFT_1034863 [Sistotremastrum suecicum HHB10207 ss-3]|uniref:Uncharacterized protein n=1 Tax=Sistotremastrum suecicum HHB10207 ss-3 TaxID=1314776 RepID=A0A166BI17_9AGAM|nr:hypothetical protein SISSUDRAFT_1034863 [Sistotremastrum suecicum HHB10207 ss-3]
MFLLLVRQNLQMVRWWCETTILEKFCGAKIADAPSEKRGLHNIEKELVAVNNKGFIAHDSRGFEAGTDAEFKRVTSFLKKRETMTDLLQKIHIIWYCIQADCRPIQQAEIKFFAKRFSSVTKFDCLVQDYMPDDEDVSGPDPYEEATDKATENFHQYYEKPLKAMPEPPDFVIKLSKVHLADPSNSILSPLIDATLSSIKSANIDILMSLATAKRLKEIIPDDFPLCIFTFTGLLSAGFTTYLNKYQSGGKERWSRIVNYVHSTWMFSDSTVPRFSGAPRDPIADDRLKMMDAFILLWCLHAVPDPVEDSVLEKILTGFMKSQARADIARNIIEERNSSTDIFKRPYRTRIAFQQCFEVFLPELQRMKIRPVDQDSELSLRQTISVQSDVPESSRRVSQSGSYTTESLPRRASSTA